MRRRHVPMGIPLAARGRVLVGAEGPRRAIGRGEVLAPGTRITAFTTRPASAGPDFGPLESLARALPLRAHPQLRGEIPPSEASIDAAAKRREAAVREFGEDWVASQPPGRYEARHGVYAAFDATAELPAQRIVDHFFATAPRDLSFGLYTTDLATAAELREETKRAIEDGISTIPIVGPLHDAAKSLGKDAGGIVKGVLVVGGLLGVAWILSNARRR